MQRFTLTTADGLVHEGVRFSDHAIALRTSGTPEPGVAYTAAYTGLNSLHDYHRGARVTWIDREHDAPEPRRRTEQEG
jgi:hypothetical protein